MKPVGASVEAYAVGFLESPSGLRLSSRLRSDYVVVVVRNGLSRAKRLAERVFEHSLAKPGGWPAVDVLVFQY